MTITDDRFHYEYDEHENCPWCGRHNDTCRCDDEELEEFYRQQEEDRCFFEQQMKLWERGYD